VDNPKVLARTVLLAVCALTVFAGLLALEARAMPTPERELMDARRDKPNLDRGAELYGTCAACHGPTGSGTVDGQVPRIAGQHASVLVKQLVDYRHDRRWDLRMERFADHHYLPDAQAIADVAAYVSRLDQDVQNGKGSGELLTRGADTYVRLCLRCHGPGAIGDAKRAYPGSPDSTTSTSGDSSTTRWTDAVRTSRRHISACWGNSIMTTLRQLPTICRAGDSHEQTGLVTP
jgi:cytochrome c553